jgi:predicted DNA-binding protein (MmcQ/YjbR family)
MKPAGRALQRLRALCLSFPETSETSSWGHPNFRAGKRTFATFERVHGRPSIAFRLDHTEVGRLLRRKHFFTTPYGRGQWISIWADAPLDWQIVADLLRRSYRVVALKRMLAALDGTSRELCEPANTDWTRREIRILMRRW